MNKAKYVQDITVIDPDTKGDIDITIFKHEGGGMFAIDSSFIDSIDTAGTEDNGVIIADPFSDKRRKVRLIWEDSDEVVKNLQQLSTQLLGDNHHLF